MTSYALVPTSAVPADSEARLLDFADRIVATSSYPDGRDLSTEFEGPAVRYAPPGSYDLEYDTDDGSVRVDVIVVAGTGLGTVTPSTSQLVTRINPDDIGFNLYGWFGQSNAGGRGLLDMDPARIDVSHPRVWAFQASGPYANRIAIGLDPLGSQDGAFGVSAAMPFARTQVELIPPNRKVLLVPSAYGATGFVTGTYRWDPAQAGNLATKAVAQLKAALAAAGPHSRIAGIVWAQGESDVTHTSTYQASLDALFAYFRTQLGLPDLPIVITQMVPDWIAITTGADVINAIHVDTPRRLEHTAFAYGPTGDPTFTVDRGAALIHYSATGQRRFALPIVEAFALAAANATSHNPAAPTEVTVTQADTTLNVAWRRPLGHVTDYQVQYRVTGAGSWTTLTRAQSLDNRAAITGIAKGTSYDVRVLAINGGYSSPASTPVTVLTVVAPGQVTGLTAGTSLATQQSLSWTPVATATGYLVEYKLHTDSSWLTFGTVTSAAAAVTSLVPETSYDYRVSAVNAGGSGTSSATVTASTGPLAGLLDDVVVPAWRAYSVTRRLTTAYAGSLFKARRSSDDATLDVGATAGLANLSALLAWAGSSSVFIDTLYDQSGNARHLTQPTLSKQPRIVNAGTLDVLNTKAMMVFDGVDDYFEDAGPGMYAAGVTSIATVLKATAGIGHVVAERKAGTNVQFYTPLGAATGGDATATGGIRNDANATILAAGNGNIVYKLNTGLRQVTVQDDGGTQTHRVDRNLSYSGTYTRSGVLTLDNWTFGASHGTAVGSFLTGLCPELVVWTANLSTAERLAAEDNLKNFYQTA